MKTNLPEVYAAGDVNGKSMFAHTAYREAEVAINNMLGRKRQDEIYAIPGVIYTNPEVAGVGETEQSAKKGLDDDQEGPDAVAAVTWRKMKAETVLSRFIVDNKWNKATRRAYDYELFLRDHLGRGRAGR